MSPFQSIFFICYLLISTIHPLSITLDDVASGEVLVKTVDVQRHLAVVQPWLRNRDSFLIVGPEGCGVYFFNLSHPHLLVFRSYCKPSSLSLSR